MKTLKYFFLAIFSLVSVASWGQSRYYDEPTDMDVNGIFIGGRYSRAQVEAQWGTPHHYSGSQSEWGLDELYQYNITQISQRVWNWDSFHFSENGMFVAFVLKWPTFALYTNLIPGGIKPGDHANKIQDLIDALIGLRHLIGTQVVYQDPVADNADLMMMHVRIGMSDDPLRFVINMKTQTIESIGFDTSI